MSDWHHILAPTDTIDDQADHLGREIQTSGETPGWAAQAIHFMVLLMTMVERSGLFRFITWVFIFASLIGMLLGSNRSTWAVSALTGMLIIVTQSMTNATRRMAEISHETSEREQLRSMVKWQAAQDSEDPRIVILTNVSLTTALDVYVIFHDVKVDGARASIENVGAGMSARFKLNHEPDFEGMHWLRISWKDRWSVRDGDESATTIHITPSNGVMLRYPSHGHSE